MMCRLCLPIIDVHGMKCSMCVFPQLIPQSVCLQSSTADCRNLATDIQNSKTKLSDFTGAGFLQAAVVSELQVYTV